MKFPAGSQKGREYSKILINGKNWRIIVRTKDAEGKIRKSHENSAIIELYDTYLGEPGSHKAHELLHTTYVKRAINK